MNLSPVNSITFGYNKRLNNKLKARLEASEQTATIKTLTQVVDSCNQTEDQIRSLEKKDRAKTDENEFQINILLDYFIKTKKFVCTMVERLFPDLNYMKTECDTYDEESTKLEPNPLDSDEIGVKKAWLWRDMLVDELTEELDSYASYIGDDVDDIDDYIIEESSTTKIETPKPNATEQSKKTKKDEGTNLIEKFIPTKHSPKGLDDVVGLDAVREDVKDLIIYPIQHPQEAQQREEDYGIEIPHFIVFHGPPGCGKTMLAQAISQETGCDMYSFDISKVGGMYVNETSSNIGKAFEYVKQIAKKSEKPVILFLDEMDSMFAKRINSNSGGSREDNKTVNTLLTLTTEAQENNIIIIGATNMFDIIDPAAKRRVDMNAYIGLPNNDEIARLLEKSLSKYEKGKTLSQNKDALTILAQELKGHSPSNINNIIKTAFKLAYKAQREVTEQDIKDAIKQSSWEKIKEKDYMPENKASQKIGFK
ncbi:MAG: ATP-binding protein [Candidatus Gastranaerophilales bacterium]|nr:ATP-binding protein [Candidatus Gastranaerophilales bacterium]